MPFSNEAHLEETFVENLTTLAPKLTWSNCPCLILVRQLPLMVLDTPDVFVCDSGGRLYLVEAKLCRNPEIRGPVFSQLQRYLHVLGAMDFDLFSYHITRAYRKHLTWEFPQPAPAGGWQTLEQILEAWHKSDPLKVPPGATLAAMLWNSIRDQCIIPVVLTDGFPEGWSIPNQVPGSTEPLQVLAIDLKGEVVRSISYRPKDRSVEGSYAPLKSTTFAEWERKKEAKASQVTDFESRLFPSAYQLLTDIVVPWVREHGLSIVGGKNSKSLSIYSGSTELIAFGPGDSDSKAQRVKHGFDTLRVLKFDPIFRRLSPREGGVQNLSKEARDFLDQTFIRLQLDCGFMRKGGDPTVVPGHPRFKPFTTKDYPDAPRWHGEFKRRYLDPDGHVHQDFSDQLDEEALRRTLEIMTEFARRSV